MKIFLIILLNYCNGSIYKMMKMLMMAEKKILKSVSQYCKLLIYHDEHALIFFHTYSFVLMKKWMKVSISYFTWENHLGMVNYTLSSTIEFQKKFKLFKKAIFFNIKNIFMKECFNLVIPFTTFFSSAQKLKKKTFQLFNFFTTLIPVAIFFSLQWLYMKHGQQAIECKLLLYTAAEICCEIEKSRN